MSRMSTAPSQRNLTLTEELEKLEQSITLTLQEIDHNFNKAHRIVTSSILPVVEKYAEHSKNVWEGSKFWKQFFEASANVSLNGYEENAQDEDATALSDSAADHATPSSSSMHSPPNPANISTPQSAHHFDASETPSSFDSPDFSTPRQPRDAPSLQTYDSPYEKLRRQVQGSTGEEEEELTPTSTLPSTPRAQTLSDSIADSSPFVAPSTARPARTASNDVLLHRVLDKNYRIQATPHTQARLPRSGAPLGQSQAKTPTTAGRRYGTRTLQNLDSSPLEEAPRIHAFESPAKEQRRVPGLSVLTPMKKAARTPGKGDATQRQDLTMGQRAATAWDSDSEDEDEGFPQGMSPPKTMQFHIPQSKLLKTPAQEASKRIVQDLLMTAGGEVSDSFDEEGSPSMIKQGNLEEDTF